MKKKRKMLKENLGNFYCHLVADGDSFPLAMTKGMQHHRMVHINSWFIFPPFLHSGFRFQNVHNGAMTSTAYFPFSICLQLLHQLKRRGDVFLAIKWLIVTSYHSHLIPQHHQGPFKDQSEGINHQPQSWQLNLTWKWIHLCQLLAFLLDL